MLKVIFTIFLFLIITVLISCRSDFIEPDTLDTYTPLALGDITQLIYVKDSSTTMLTMVDKTQRKDGKIVYVGEMKDGTQEPTKSYFTLSNGYFVVTEIEPVGDVSSLLIVNPYREQRLAKSHPAPGETWFHIPGSPDSNYVVAEKNDTITTLFGEVDKVYRFGFFYKNSSSPFLINYYAKGMGWIASSGFSFYSNPSEIQFMCSYKKVSGKTYGEHWPEKDFSDNRLKPANYSRHISRIFFENKMMMINGELSSCN